MLTKTLEISPLNVVIFSGGNFEKAGRLFQRNGKEFEEETWNFKNKDITINSRLLNRHWKRWLWCFWSKIQFTLSILHNTTICWFSDWKHDPFHQSKHIKIQINVLAFVLFCIIFDLSFSFNYFLGNLQDRR